MRERQWSPSPGRGCFSLGDPSARPAGLERALTRAGFQLVEREDPSVDSGSRCHSHNGERISTRVPSADLLPTSGPGPPGSPPYRHHRRHRPGRAGRRPVARRRRRPGGADPPARALCPAARPHPETSWRRLGAPAGTAPGCDPGIDPARASIRTSWSWRWCGGWRGPSTWPTAPSSRWHPAPRPAGSSPSSSVPASDEEHLELSRHPEIAEAVRTRRAVVTVSALPVTRPKPPATLIVLPVEADDRVSGTLSARHPRSPPPSQPAAARICRRPRSQRAAVALRRIGESG